MKKRTWRKKQEEGTRRRISQPTPYPNAVDTVTGEAKPDVATYPNYDRSLSPDEVPPSSRLLRDSLVTVSIVDERFFFFLPKMVSRVAPREFALLRGLETDDSASTCRPSSGSSSVTLRGCVAAAAAIKSSSSSYGTNKEFLMLGRSPLLDLLEARLGSAPLIESPKAAVTVDERGDGEMNLLEYWLPCARAKAAEDRCGGVVGLSRICRSAG